MTKYVYAIMKDVMEQKPGVYVFISNKTEFEETGYASDHDYFPKNEAGEDINLDIRLEEMMEGCYRVEDETLSVNAIQLALAKCPRLIDSLAFKAFVRRSLQ